RCCVNSKAVEKRLRQYGRTQPERCWEGSKGGWCGPVMERWSLYSVAKNTRSLIHMCNGRELKFAPVKEASSGRCSTAWWSSQTGCEGKGNWPSWITVKGIFRCTHTHPSFWGVSARRSAVPNRRTQSGSRGRPEKQP